MQFLSAAADSLWPCNGETEEEKKMGQRWRRDAVDAKCPPDSHGPQIWPKSEVLGQVLGVSQWPQITVA